MNDPTELADRYVAIWNEPDPEARRRTVRELWSEDAAQVLEPPEVIREAADALGAGVVLETRGHAALEQRVTHSYDAFVARDGMVFRRLGRAARLRDVVEFRWEAAPRDGGEAIGSGLEILVLDEDGRIRLDYQFVES